jgi:hypothetical protein
MARTVWVKFDSAEVGPPLRSRAQQLPPSVEFQRTRLGKIAARDLLRYYAAIEDLQQRPPLTAAELDVVRRSLPAPGEWRSLDARLLWQRVERALRDGAMEVPSGVDSARLIEKLREMPLFQLAAIVDLAERTRTEDRAPI